MVTGTDVAPDAAPADVAVNAWLETVTVVLPGTATLNAFTGMALMVPLIGAVVAVNAGSSGGRSSLATRPPFRVKPL